MLHYLAVHKTLSLNNLDIRGGGLLAFLTVALCRPGSFGAGERRPFSDGTLPNFVVPTNDKEQRRLRSVFADPTSGLNNRMSEANGFDEDACWPNVQQNEVKHR